tara:strand:- start:336 stop:458 length:123 start_codon:yes stop_codon:yes gene_type:complete
MGLLGKKKKAAPKKGAKSACPDKDGIPCAGCRGGNPCLAG